MPLESKILTMAIENAQKKVEAYNFDIRKSLLEYDNVLNKQREIIYNERNRVLESIDIQEHVNDMIREIAEGVAHNVSTSDLRVENQYDSLNNALYEITGTYPSFKDLDRVKNLSSVIFDYLLSLYQKKEKMVGAEGMRNIEQQILIYIVDNKWKDHLYGMDHLKEGIGLRGYGQQDPLMVYQKEGFQMFEDMLGSIKEEVVQLLFKIQINPMVAKPQTKESQSMDDKGGKTEGEKGKNRKPELASPKKSLKIGRNDPCPCGSGKKYKKCCGTGEASD
jgi:preprotein translocase subunit SecA